MHPLLKYLKTCGLSREDFAVEVDSSLSYINQIVVGSRHPSRELAKSMAEATGGKVDAAQFLLFEREPKKRKRGKRAA